jgi:hypothetical protein
MRKNIENMKKTIMNLSSMLIYTITLFIISGCDPGGGITIPSGSSEMTVNIKADDNILDAIVITEAKALISDLEFEKESTGTDELHKKGPFVINLNLNGTFVEMSKQRIIRDIYTKAKFIIHKPLENEEPSDPEFKEGTTEDKRYSFIVKGTYNGSNFVFKSTKGFNVIINFAAPNNINLAKSNLTIIFNKTKWFKSGSNELNPSDPQNAEIINENIRTSFVKVIRDDNLDGVEDN